MKKSNLEKENQIFGMVWLAILFIPAGDFFYILVPFLLLLINCKSMDRKFARINIYLALLIILAIVINHNQPYLEYKDIFRAIEIVLCIVCFGTVKAEKIPIGYIMGALVIIVFSQIAYFFSIEPLVSIYENIYNVSDYMITLYGEGYRADLHSIRSGGIYANPNVCSSYLTIIYILGLVEIKKFGHGSKSLLMIITLIGVVLSGSRTALLIYAFITINFIYFENYANKKNIIILIGLMISCLLMLPSLRGLEIESGVTGSLNTKFQILIDYVKNIGHIQFLLGAGSPNITLKLLHSDFGGSDFDLGNILICYGFLFWILYAIYNIEIYRNLRKECKLILYMQLWIFSNSILISYRMCPLWFIVTSLLYKQSRYLNK